LERLLEDLVKIKSYQSSPSEMKKCKNFLKTKLRDLEVPNSTIRDVNDNIILDIDADSNETLGILLHYDVLEHSKKPEFEEENGFYKGVGVTSAKGALAAIIQALEEVEEFERNLKLIITKDETTGSHEGTRHLVENHQGLIEADYYWIPDCTDQYISIGNYHILAAHIDIEGDGGHPAYDKINNNTNLECIKAAEKIQSQIEKEEKRYGSDVIANIISMKSSDTFNKVPEKAHMIVEFRLHPSHSYKELKQRLEETLEQINASIDFEIDAYPGFVIDNPEEIELIDQFKEEHGKSLKIEKGNHDGAVIGCKMEKPVIGFLPGGENLHTYQEKVKKRNLEKIRKNLIRLVKS